MCRLRLVSKDEPLNCVKRVLSSCKGRIEYKSHPWLRNANSGA